LGILLTCAGRSNRELLGGLLSLAVGGLMMAHEVYPLL
jgi:hypothetical protein